MFSHLLSAASFFFFSKKKKSVSNPEVVVNHVGDLFSAEEQILFLSFLFFQTDVFLEARILDDLVQGRTQSSCPASRSSGNE